MLRSYAVWDAGTRWFHWINALSVLALAIVGVVILQSGDIGAPNPGKVTLKKIHVIIGCVLAINLAWRFAWTFMGDRYARWRAILPGGRGFCHALRSYVAAFLAGHPEPYLGHNPAGRPSVSVLLLLITVLALSGLVLAGTDFFFPPSGGRVEFRAPFILVHEYGFYALAGLVALHVGAAIVAAVKEGGSLISAMFTGRRILDRRPRDADDEGPGPRDTR